MAGTERRSLGRGLDALIPRSSGQSATPPAGASREPMEIPIERIQRNPAQPRKRFDNAALENLANSIRERGILQPLLLAPEGDRYIILAGERRWRAAQAAGLRSVPAVIRPASDEATRLELALIENLQRENLNAIEEAVSFKALLEAHGYTQEALGKVVGRSRPGIANALRLLTLPNDVQQMVIDGKIEAGHARALAGIEEAATIRDLAREAAAKGLSVREVESRVARLKKADSKPKSPAPSRFTESEKVHFQHLEDTLTRQTGLRVHIHPESNVKGRVELDYGSLEEFDRIVARLKRS